MPGFHQQRSLSTVNVGGNEMEPMELISINEGCGKDVIAAAVINRHCSQRWQPPLPLMTNNDSWLQAAIVINCAAAVMMAINGGDSGCH